MRTTRTGLRLCTIVLGWACGASLQAEAAEVVNVNYVTVVEASCDSDWDQWSLVAQLGESIPLGEPYIVRMTRAAAFLRFNAPSIKSGGKQPEPNLSLRMAIVYRIAPEDPNIPPNVVDVLLNRSYRNPLAVSGECIDEDLDGSVMAQECDPDTETAMYRELRQHGQSGHTELAIKAYPGSAESFNATLRACVAAAPNTAVPQAGLIGLLGTGSMVIER